jgi:hypothetical protein
VLLTAAGLGTAAIMQQTGKSKPVVWRWQERFMQAGVDGLLRDKNRPPRIAPLAQAVIDRVVALTSADPPGETTHWTASAMAKAAGISPSSVRRIWCAHGLGLHRIRQFKLRTDKAFAEAQLELPRCAALYQRHRQEPRSRRSCPKVPYFALTTSKSTNRGPLVARRLVPVALTVCSGPASTPSGRQAESLRAPLKRLRSAQLINLDQIYTVRESIEGTPSCRPR